MKTFSYKSPDGARIIKWGKQFLHIPRQLYRELRVLLRYWFMFWKEEYFKEHFPTVFKFFQKEMTTPLEEDLEDE